MFKIIIFSLDEAALLGSQCKPSFSFEHYSVRYKLDGSEGRLKALQLPSGSVTGKVYDITHYIVIHTYIYTRTLRTKTQNN